MADSPEEKAHWRSVLKAYDGYMQYHLSANHARRMAFLSLPKEQREIYESIGFKDKLEAVDEGIRRNAEFIDEMIADPVFADMMASPESSSSTSSHSHSHEDTTHSHAHGHPHSHSRHSGHDHGGGSSLPGSAKSSTADKKAAQAENDMQQDKVRSTLRSFVRDWAVQGQAEREACYTPCLDALERYFPSAIEGKGKGRADTRVLVPGCGLGRLATEIAARGFTSQANEFSTHMLIASHFVLNQTTSPFSHTIFPYLHSFSNHLTTEKHLLKSVRVPDICPADVLGDGQGGDFSLVAGDFEEIYGPQHWGEGEDAQDGKWDAVVTCFFIDCSRNILTYLRIMHTLLKPGGVWINIGPLLWHFENSPTTSAKGEGSIELSLDEVKYLARNVGFDIHDEKMVKTSYTGIQEGMLRHEYNAAFWTATKRDSQS